jgi:hypothetical protein
MPSIVKALPITSYSQRGVFIKGSGCVLVTSFFLAREWEGDKDKEHRITAPNKRDFLNSNSK